jgi:anti-sigma factor RsiW
MRRQHVISLIAIAVPGRADAVPARETAAGYNMLRWTEHGVAYWAISDLNAKELDDFARLFRTAPAEG